MALGNIADPVAVTALAETLRHERPRIRAYSAWSLGRIGGAPAREALTKALGVEENENTAAAMRAALETMRQ